jgi:hypothetical protein
MVRGDPLPCGRTLELSLLLCRRSLLLSQKGRVAVGPTMVGPLYLFVGVQREKEERSCSDAKVLVHG